MRRLTGIPYAAGGSDWDGADCYGLARIAGAEVFGVALPAVDAAITDGGGWRPVADGDERGGDVAEMRTIVDGAERLHCGLVLRPGELLTTSAATGSHIVRYDARRRRGIVRFWRAPE